MTNELQNLLEKKNIPITPRFQFNKKSIGGDQVHIEKMMVPPPNTT